MTALAEQFAKAGVSANVAELRVALSKFLNSGGTVAQARAELDAIERMSGMGQFEIARNSHRGHAQTRQPVEDGGADLVLAQGQSWISSSSSSNHDELGRTVIASDGQQSDAPSRRVPDRGGEGQTSYAPSRLSSRVLPVREPTMQQRMISARNARVVAITIMDTKKIDGRPVGDWTVAEARLAGRLKTNDGYILIAAARVVANTVGNELLREVVKPEEMQKIIQKAAEMADAV